MFLVQFIFILCFCLYSVTGQACDTSRDTPQCSDGERCSYPSNTCQTAVPCSERSNCSTGNGMRCSSDYCQPYSCTSTGQCVHGQVCPRRTYSRKSCAYPVMLDAEEGSNVTLTFDKPSAPGPDEVWVVYWDREGRLQIAAVRLCVNHEIRSFVCGHDLYLNPTYELPRIHGPVKATINRTTGALTLIKVTVEEEGYYYFELWSLYARTELKYEYRLKLNVIPSATIQGVSDKPVEVGNKVTLTCTPVKVHSKTTGIYWVVGGRNESGTITRGKGLLTISLVHEVTKEDEGNPITCVVVPRFTDPITVEKYINPGYAPSGKPVIKVSTMGQYKREKVTLTCENPEVTGNPPCNTYTWTRLEGNINYLPNTQIFTFIIGEFHPGNYTCRCRNVFGESTDSDSVQIVYLGETPVISLKEQAGLIAGCVIGVLVLVAFVIVAVFICKQYSIKLIIQTKTRDQSTTRAGGMDNRAYEIPVSNPEPSNTDNNNTVNGPKSEGFVNNAFTTC